LCWFGDVIDSLFVPNRSGEIVEEVWRSLPSRFDQVILVAYVTMPNHVHGLLTLKQGQTSLGSVIRAFKGASTFQIRASGEGNFGWKRNYHEHIVRNDQTMTRIRRYIRDNPRTWDIDIFHPDADRT
jgi:REP element-mobilizing transposase RayT